VTTDFAPLVAAGARLIEDRKPGAVALLDPAALRLASPSCCPLGQTFGSYDKGLRELRLADSDAVRHGFMWPSTGFGSGRSSHDLIEEIEDAWKAVIRSRQVKP
jgi:hypothetical protein